MVHNSCCKLILQIGRLRTCTSFYIDKFRRRMFQRDHLSIRSYIFTLTLYFITTVQQIAPLILYIYIYTCSKSCTGYWMRAKEEIGERLSHTGYPDVGITATFRLRGVRQGNYRIMSYQWKARVENFRYECRII